MEERIIVKIKRLNNSVPDRTRTPFYASKGAAGADLYACLDNDLTISAGERVGVPTGIAIELPGPEIAAFVFARSGLASQKGLALSNGVGVIDSDYRGEIVVLMINLGQEAVTVKNGDRIAQLLLCNVCRAVFVETDELQATRRGRGGFGSTGQ